MPNLHFSSFAAAAMLALSPAQAGSCAPADADLAGRYVLRGVMEVGSELALSADGRFQYMLAYGALDESAAGCWSRRGDTVTLQASTFENSMEDPLKFSRLNLHIAPGGKLRRLFDAGHSGDYERY